MRSTPWLVLGLLALLLVLLPLRAWLVQPLRLVLAGEWTAARTAYERQRRSWLRSVRRIADYNVAMCSANLGETELALTQLHRVLQSETTPWLHDMAERLEGALLLRTRRDPALALERLQRPQLAGTAALCAADRAFALAQLGRHNEARAQLRSMPQLESRDRNTWFGTNFLRVNHNLARASVALQCGLAWLELGEPHEAVPLLQQAYAASVPGYVRDTARAELERLGAPRSAEPEPPSLRAVSLDD